MVKARREVTSEREPASPSERESTERVESISKSSMHRNIVTAWRRASRTSGDLKATFFINFGVRSFGRKGGTPGHVHPCVRHDLAGVFPGLRPGRRPVANRRD